MINTIQARVLGAMHYSMDNGVKGAKITLMSESDPNNEDLLGYQVSTISAPYEILDQLHAHAPHMPCNLEIDAEMRTTKGKMTMHAIAVRKPSSTGHSGNTAKADTPKTDTAKTA